MREFVMPRLSLSDEEEMVVAKWLCEEGGQFEEGDPLLEVETAKASVQVEAPGPGILARVVVQADQPIRQGELLGWLGDVGEDVGNFSSTARPPSGGKSAPDGIVGLGSTSVQAPGDANGAVQIGVDGPPPWIPGASIVESGHTGPGEFYGLPTYRGQRMVRRRGASGSWPRVHGDDTGVRALTKHRSALARLMTESAAIPQFSVRKHVPMEGAMDAVRHLRDRGVAVTLTDVLLRATALTLVQHPELSAHYIGDAIRYFPAPVISLATDSPNGVIAPVLRSPERLSWSDLADQRRHIVEGARAGKLLPVNLNGGTFSLSNVGAVGGDAVVPLLTPPQVAILGVGAVRPSSAGAVSTMDLVVDHRALDGADAARFLVTLADLLRAGSPATSFDLEGA